MQILIDHYYNLERPGVAHKMEDENGDNFSNKKNIEEYTRSYHNRRARELAHYYVPRVDEELPNVIKVSFNLLNYIFDTVMDYGCSFM